MTDGQAFERARQLFLRALADQEAGRLAEAEAGYREALGLAPERPSILGNLAALLIRGGRLDEAEPLCAQALRVAPEAPASLLNQGALDASRGRHVEALGWFRRALAVEPGNVEAIGNAAGSLAAIGDLAGALASYARARALDPDNAALLVNEGIALLDAQRAGDALACFDRALALRPDLAKAHASRGNALLGQGRGEAALAAYRRAAGLDPSLPRVQGRLLVAQLRCGDWAGIADVVRRIRADVAAGGAPALPFDTLLAADDPQLQLAAATEFARSTHPAVPLAERPAPPARAQGGRTVVAYLSSDFRAHPVADQLVPVLEHHDRTSFEIIAVGFAPAAAGPVPARIAAAVDRLIDARTLPDDQLAALLRREGVDIAVNLNGYTDFHRMSVFAHRAAPVQVSWLGYPGTTGAPYIDYLIADPFVVPPASERYFTERIVRLPGTFFPAGADKAVDPAPRRADVGLPDGAFVFCSFSNAQKIGPTIFDVWMRILGATPGAVLWLSGHPEPFPSNLRREAARRGVDPARLHFAPFAPERSAHLARYRTADLFLDTFPYTGHTTASEALWAGLPVVTCAGATFTSRVSGSILHAAGLGELVLPSLDAFEAEALALATDPARMRRVRALAEASRGTALFSPATYTPALESAYRAMLAAGERSAGAGPPAAQ